MPGAGIVERAVRIGEDVAGRWADDVDRAARFPVETVDALRASGLLAALVPEALGGPGASVEEMAGAVTALAAHCASSGLILAMHQIQVATLVRHGTPAGLDLVLPRLLDGSLLLANAASEVGLAGARRSSLCALVPDGPDYRIDKQASTVSYGEHADGVLVTARRTPDSPAHDQSMVVCLRPDLDLEPTGDWDTLGLRGTCSRPARLAARVPPELVIEDYPAAFVRTSLPVSAVLLGSVWLGIAEAAARVAHASVRDQARRQRRADPDAAAPISALRLAELGVPLHQLRSVVAGGALEYERHKDTPEVETLRFSGAMDNLKLSSSTLVLTVVQRALAITGLAGYRNQGPFTLARILRDAAAAPLMVNNDRALQATAQAVLVRKEL
jgi:acyl-CoA dehydrogenase